MSPRWHQLPHEPFLARLIPETNKKCCATLRPNVYFFGDAGPMPPASDYKSGDKSNLFGKVRSRARETLTFEALQNSSRKICRLAHTKHLLSSILQFRIPIRAREAGPSSCCDSDSLRQPSGRTLAGWAPTSQKFVKAVFMSSHKQVFRVIETTTFRRLEFMLDSGPRKRSSRARETPTF